MDGLEDPVVVEFLEYRSYHPVVTFFLGFIFMACIRFTLHIPLAAARRIRSYIKGEKASLHDGLGLKADHLSGNDCRPCSTQSTDTSASSNPPRPSTHNLSLSLTVCFALASVADFGSLLVFDRQYGLTACAFLVASGGIATHCARLLGLLKLSLDMRKLRVHSCESYIFWSLLLVATLVILSTTTLGVGTTRLLPDPKSNKALCYRKHFLPLATASSGINVMLELYSLLRIYSLIVPAFLSSRHKFDALQDVRVARALSLLILDLATAVPAAHFYGILADFLPGSLATLFVLVTFNHQSPDVTLPPTVSITNSCSGSTYDQMCCTALTRGSSQKVSPYIIARHSLPPKSPVTFVCSESIKQPCPITPDSQSQTWWMRRTSCQTTVPESDPDVSHLERLYLDSSYGESYFNAAHNGEVVASPLIWDRHSAAYGIPELPLIRSPVSPTARPLPTIPASGSTRYSSASRAQSEVDRRYSIAPSASELWSTLPRASSNSRALPTIPTSPSTLRSTVRSELELDKHSMVHSGPGLPVTRPPASLPATIATSASTRRAAVRSELELHKRSVVYSGPGLRVTRPPTGLPARPLPAIPASLARHSVARSESALHMLSWRDGWPIVSPVSTPGAGPELPRQQPMCGKLC